MEENTAYGDAERGWDREITMWPHKQQLSTEAQVR